MIPIETKTSLTGMYQEWFLDYASYVILERALPNIADGLKPVQRRILHTMRTLDDGRYNKVANIIGATMSYHPHGDQSIGNTLVSLGQKCLLIDTQGNWGNLLTGDSAAAPRYIEARLSSLALDTVYSPQITEWTRSYDGRKDEPVTLPVKFPLLLAQGASGIAVGLASKILPHNFNEILDAAIECLHNRPFTLYPDFPTGALMDVAQYNDGAEGGKIKIRARIEKADAKTLVITQIPYGKTTQTVISSIYAAIDKGNIDIRKIEDNTAREARIILHLGTGVSPDRTIEALYAFTDCEVTVGVNCCVIKDHSPQFLCVSELLKDSVARTVGILRMELQNNFDATQDALYFIELEKIFIGQRFYEDQEVKMAPDMESAIRRVSTLFEPFKPKLFRQITDSDLIRLWEIRMGRILKFNAIKADEQIARLGEKIALLRYEIEHIVETTEKWYVYLKERYGADYPRHTEIRALGAVDATKVAVANRTFYHDSANGFIGMSLKEGTPIFECSEHDDIIVIYNDGRYKVVHADKKIYIGKSVIHIGLYKKRDSRMIYNVIYRNGKDGHYYMKRFNILGIARNKEYNITKALPGSRIEWLTCNQNGEAETVGIELSDERGAMGRKPRISKLTIDFAKQQVKGREALGNLVTKYKIKRISLLQKGVSTLSGVEVWFDSNLLRLNYEGKGKWLGTFEGDDKVLVITNQGDYFTSSYSDLIQFENNIYLIEKYVPAKVWTLAFFDNAQGFAYLKRFVFEETEKPSHFVGTDKSGDILLLTDMGKPVISIKTDTNGRKGARTLNIVAEEFVGLKSYRAKGKRLTTERITEITALPVADNLPSDNHDNVDEPSAAAHESANGFMNMPSLFDSIDN